MRRFSGGHLAVVGSVLACALALVQAVPASASSSTATSASSSKHNGYLALGDSVPYGFDPLLLKPGVDPDSFVGYPQLASSLFKQKLQLTNASCPGETSTSLITGTRPDNGCQDYRQFIGKLHVSYPGSQLQYAKTYLAANPQTKLVSLSIGGNELFQLREITCAGAANVEACMIVGLPAVLRTLKANLSTIYSSLRAAGFRGELVVSTYYSTNYADPFVTAMAFALDHALVTETRSHGGKILDGFGAFGKASLPFKGDTCKAGLLIHLTPTTCDIHPSPAGAALLARALHSAVKPAEH